MKYIHVSIIVMFLLVTFIVQAENTDLQFDTSTIIGRGTAKALDWRDSGDFLAIASSTGVWIYDSSFEFTTLLEADSNEPFYDIQWSPDGLYLAELAFSSDHSTLRIWEFSNAQFLLRQQFKLETSGKLVWRPDSTELSVGKQVYNPVTGAMRYPYTYRIEDYFTGELYYTKEGGPLWWNEDGSKFIGYSRGIPGDIKRFAVYDNLSGNLMVELEGWLWTFSDFSWHGNLIFTNGATYDALTGEMVVAESPVIQLDYPYGWGSSWTLAPWSLEEEIQETIFIDLPDELIGLTPAPYDRDIITAITGSGYIINMNLRTGAVTEFQLLFPSIQSFAWSPDSTQIVTRSLAATKMPLQLWSIPETGWITEPDEYINPDFYENTAHGNEWFSGDIRWLSADEVIVTNYTNLPLPAYQFVIEKWSLKNGEKETIFNREVKPNDPFRRSSVSPNGRFHITITTDELEFFDTTTQDVVFTFESPVDHIPLVWLWSPDSRLFAASYELPEGDVTYVWESARGQIVETLDYVMPEIDANWSPNGQYLTVQGPDGNLLIFDFETMEAKAIFEEGVFIHSATWSPDSRMLVYVERGDTPRVVLWDLEPNRKNFLLEGGRTRFQWSPDGSRLAMWVGNSTIEVIDVFK